MNYRVRRMLGLEEKPLRLSKRVKDAVILGCGPAGLFAAHALAERGWGIRIYSKKRPSHLYGAQYLHAPIPGLTPDAEPIRIEYKLTGSVDGYREKVYGSMPVKVSPEALDMNHDAWDLRATYDAAWDRYERFIVHQEIGPDFLQNGALPRGTDLVISTIPMPTICYKPDEHQFHAARIWAYGDAPARGQRAPFRPGEGVVECNGSRDVGWYRASNIYGHVTVEWPHSRKPPLPGVAEVVKPIYTDCNCYRDGAFPRRFVPLGRYGQWSKGVLTHHAYTQAAQL